MSTISNAKAGGSSNTESPDTKAAAGAPGKGSAATVSGGRSSLPVLFHEQPAKTGFDKRAFGFGALALAIGTILGAGATVVSTHRTGNSETVIADTNAGLEANRVEAARLNGEIEKLTRTLDGMRETGESLRADARSHQTALTERVTKLEQTLSGKVAALGERFEKDARDQSGQLAALTAQLDKRPAAVPAVIAAPVAAVAAPAAPKAEPLQTAAITDAKKAPATPPVIEGWALREVYNGTAVLEDRRRRLFEAVLGENIPGAGHVEAIEKRGRNWVVVTKQGVITSQAW